MENYGEKTGYKEYRAIIDAGNIDEKAVSATAFRILSITSNADVEVTINRGVEYTLKAGLGFRDDKTEIRHIQLRNAGTSQITVEYAIGNGDIWDSRLSLSGVISVLNVSDEIDSPVAISCSDTVATLASDANAKEVIIQNNGTENVWFGDSNVDPATMRGTLLEPGDTMVMDCNAEISFKCDTGETTTVSVNRLKA